MSILQKLGIQAGKHASAAFHKMDKEHVRQSLKRAREIEKKKCQSTRQLRKQQGEDHIESEGVTYEPGGF